MNGECFREDELSLHLFDDDEAVRVVWAGRSTARDPKFVLPVLLQGVARAGEIKRPLVLDFRGVVAMSAAMLTLVARALHVAKRTDARVRVVYDKELRWQEASFSALRPLQTVDRRIAVVGV